MCILYNKKKKYYFIYHVPFLIFVMTGRFEPMKNSFLFISILIQQVDKIKVLNS